MVVHHRSMGHLIAWVLRKGSFASDELPVDCRIWLVDMDGHLVHVTSRSSLRTKVVECRTSNSACSTDWCTGQRPEMDHGLRRKSTGAEVTRGSLAWTPSDLPFDPSSLRNVAYALRQLRTAIAAICLVRDTQVRPDRLPEGLLGLIELLHTLSWVSEEWKHATRVVEGARGDAGDRQQVVD